MDAVLILLILLIMSFAGMVQAAVGFGAGMIAIPLLIWAGLDLPAAIGLMAAGTFGQLTVKVVRYRKQIDWKLVLWPMMAGRILGYVPGFIALWWLAGSTTMVVKQVVGGVVLLALFLQVGLRVKPRERLHEAWAWVAGFFSGLSGAAVGMGGPPTVLWVLAHDWPGHQARQYLWASFWVLMPVYLATLLVMFGLDELKYMGLGVATLPVVMLGMAAGLWIGHRIPKRQLRWAMIGLLIVLGVVSIVGPMVGGG
ncbi:MAG: sulfite exporter TauE/SafE family protein [Planctomycetota bacterium]